MAFSTAALCVRSAAIAVCRATSIDPERPPKSSTVYERLSEGPYWFRSPAGRPGVAICSDRLATTPAVTVGKTRPCVDPYTSAAATAWVYESLVAGLFLSARSTTSASEYGFVVAEAAAAIIGLVTVSRAAAAVTFGDG